MGGEREGGVLGIISWERKSDEHLIPSKREKGGRSVASFAEEKRELAEGEYQKGRGAVIRSSDRRERNDSFYI